jgi:hypothetical protein
MNVVPKRSATSQVGLAWNWQYDADFVHALDRSLHQAGISCFLVGHHNLAQTILEVHNGERQFLWFLDRASDEDKHFLALNHLLQTTGTRFLNAHDRYLRAADKAEIHRDLLVSGLCLPRTLILPPLDREPDLDPALIATFTKPFVVKPARGGGGRGVLTGAQGVDDVKRTRTSFRDQRFLVQQSIEPQQLGDRRAWFRVYYCCGQTIPVWWDDRTHRYALMTPSDAKLVNIPELERIARLVAEVAELDFFSTEVALDQHGRYVVIDYVNTPCDMRPQSKHFNGVPDTIVTQITAAITNYLKAQITATAPPTDDRHLWP